MPVYKLNIQATCAELMAQEVTCLVCLTSQAVGHTRVEGGPFDGRLLLVHCLGCVPMPGAVEEGAVVGLVKEALLDYAQSGLLDVRTGGPGPRGEPVLIHGDHSDPWPSIGEDRL